MQTAIILAAGQGKRLRPLTDSMPKCLLTIGSRPILCHQLDALQNAGIDHFVVVVGFQDHMVRDAVQREFPSLSVEYVLNESFDSAQNLVSLAMATTHIPHSRRVLQLNGDVMFDASIARDMLSQNPQKSYSLIRCEACGDEEMKVVLRADGTIREMNKRIPSGVALGEAIGAHLFSSVFWSSLAATLSVLRHSHPQEYFEYAIERTVEQLPLYPYDIKTARAIEIDFEADLEKARAMFVS